MAYRPRVERVELIADHTIPVPGRVATLEDHADIVQSLLVRNTDHTARFHSHLYRLIIATPITNIVETLGGQ